MSLSSALVISAFTLLAPSSDIAKQTPVSSLEVASRIEQRAEVNQTKDSFTRTMGSNDQIASNKSVESSINAVQPQLERTTSAILAVYQGNEAPAFTLRTGKEVATRVESQQWDIKTYAHAPSERSAEMGNLAI